MQTETYHCPSHGPISYDPQRLLKGYLGEATQVIDVGLAGLVQPLTGIEIVH